MALWGSDINSWMRPIPIRCEPRKGHDVAIVLMDSRAGWLPLDNFVDAEGFGEILGVDRKTIHAYRKLAAPAERKLSRLLRKYSDHDHPEVIKARRAVERARARQVPDPWAYVAGVPMWTKDQACTWRDARPGRGGSAA
jgi:hypothetical protein